MGTSLAEQLERLEALRDAGTLSDDEFVAAKARLLDGDEGDGAPASQASDAGQPWAAWPPSPTAPAALPAPQGGVAPKGLRTLGGWLQGLLWATGIASGLAALAALLGLSAYLDWRDGIGASDEVWFAVDLYYGVWGLFSLGLLVTGVVFVVWLWRADTQAKALAPERPARYRRGWTIAGWFIPIASFVIPKQIVDDVWRRAEPAAITDSRVGSAPPDDAPHRALQVPALLHWWWGLLLAGWLFTNASAALDPYTADLSQAGGFFALSALWDALLAAAAVLAVFVVRRISHRLHERAHRVAPPSGYPVS